MKETREQKIQRRQAELRRVDDWLLRLHSEHKWYALALAFGCALVLCGLAWLLKVSVNAVIHFLVGR